MRDDCFGQLFARSSIFNLFLRMSSLIYLGFNISRSKVSFFSAVLDFSALLMTFYHFFTSSLKLSFSFFLSVIFSIGLKGIIGMTALELSLMLSLFSEKFFLKYWFLFESLGFRLLCTSSLCIFIKSWQLNDFF